ncbi:MAG: hypothetical protein JHD35_08475 [Sphingopyxis sp.]|nr:hypothetical protein [Sphingopyxis sp.]
MNPILLFAILIQSQTSIGFPDEVSSRYHYGPTNGRGDGYEDKVTEDGFWKISARVGFSGAYATDMAIYRAAEMAKAKGSRYVEIHDAVSRRNNMTTAESVTLFARATDAPVHPTACRSGKPDRCYTADVALVFARLSGADGKHPGIAAPSYIDKEGRTVARSGFGTGAVGVAQ